MSRVFFFCVLLLSSSTYLPVLAEENEQSYWDKAREYAGCWGLPIFAGMATVAAAPVVLPAMGFTAGGIAAGSVAAKAMSVAATTGYGLGAISAAQSAGATGLAVTTKVAVGVTSAFTTWYYAGCADPDCDKDKDKKLNTLLDHKMK